MFGIDRLAHSLVLTEEDYMKFIVSIGENQLLPIDVRFGLVYSFNTVVGFDVHDWAFKALLYGVMEDIPTRYRGGIVQILAQTRV